MNPTYEMYKTTVETALQNHPLLAGSWDNITVAPSMPPLEGEIPQPLRSAMRYSLMLPGKRIRPVLLLASYHLLQADWKSVLPFAMALEMIHTYSLIHDDLPALDNDILRRGQPTCHIVYGEDVALLAGDALYSLAFETMLEAALVWTQPSKAIAAIETIARHAGVRGMIAGQTLDVTMEGKAPEASIVTYIHQHKTADLLTAPVLAGLILAGANEHQLAAGNTFGKSIGLAFQIIDDLLDQEGDEKTLGKQTGTDAARGKMTWPAVHGAQTSRRQAEVYIQEAIRALDVFGESADFLKGIAQATLTRVS